VGRGKVGVLARSAAVLFSTRADYSSPLHPPSGGVASAQHAHPATVLSYELQVESALHMQQVVAFVGDILYFVCAIAMEAAYYHDQAQGEQQDKERKDNVAAHEGSTAPGGTAGRRALPQQLVLPSMYANERSNGAGAIGSPPATSPSPTAPAYESVLTPAAALRSAELRQMQMRQQLHSDGDSDVRGLQHTGISS